MPEITYHKVSLSKLFEFVDPFAKEFFDDGRPLSRKKLALSVKTGSSLPISKTSSPDKIEFARRAAFVAINGEPDPIDFVVEKDGVPKFVKGAEFVAAAAAKGLRSAYVRSTGVAAAATKAFGKPVPAPNVDFKIVDWNSMNDEAASLFDSPSDPKNDIIQEIKSHQFDKFSAIKQIALKIPNSFLNDVEFASACVAANHSIIMFIPEETLANPKVFSSISSPIEAYGLLLERFQKDVDKVEKFFSVGFPNRKYNLLSVISMASENSFYNDYFRISFFTFFGSVRETEFIDADVKKAILELKDIDKIQKFIPESVVVDDPKFGISLLSKNGSNLRSSPFSTRFYDVIFSDPHLADFAISSLPAFSLNDSFAFDAIKRNPKVFSNIELLRKFFKKNPKSYSELHQLFPEDDDSFLLDYLSIPDKIPEWGWNAKEKLEKLTSDEAFSLVSKNPALLANAAFHPDPQIPDSWVLDPVLHSAMGSSFYFSSVHERVLNMLAELPKECERLVKDDRRNFLKLPSKAKTADLCILAMSMQSSKKSGRDHEDDRTYESIPALLKAERSFQLKLLSVNSSFSKYVPNQFHSDYSFCKSVMEMVDSGFSINVLDFNPIAKAWAEALIKAGGKGKLAKTMETQISSRELSDKLRNDGNECAQSSPSKNRKI